MFCCPTPHTIFSFSRFLGSRLHVLLDFLIKGYYLDTEVTGRRTFITTNIRSYYYLIALQISLKNDLAISRTISLAFERMILLLSLSKVPSCYRCGHHHWKKLIEIIKMMDSLSSSSLIQSTRCSRLEEGSRCPSPWSLTSKLLVTNNLMMREYTIKRKEGEIVGGIVGSPITRTISDSISTYYSS